jgi:aminoglycoside phosphotransferase
LNIPDDVKKIIGDKPYQIDTVGMSSSHVVIYDDCVLKVEQQSETSDNEHIMITWLADKLPVPKVLYSSQNNGFNYLLMSKLNGSSRFFIKDELPAHVLNDIARAKQVTANNTINPAENRQWQNGINMPLCQRIDR